MEDLYPPSIGASHRLHQYLHRLRDDVVAPLDEAVAAVRELKAAWIAGGMTAALAAWPKVAGQYEGIPFAAADLAALVKLLADLDALVTASPILEKIRGVK